MSEDCYSTVQQAIHQGRKKPLHRHQIPDVDGKGITKKRETTCLRRDVRLSKFPSRRLKRRGPENEGDENSRPATQCSRPGRKEQTLHNQRHKVCVSQGRTGRNRQICRYPCRGPQRPTEIGDNWWNRKSARGNLDNAGGEALGTPQAERA